MEVPKIKKNPWLYLIFLQSPLNRDYFYEKKFMYYPRSIIRHIFLIVLCIIYSNTYADITGMIKPYLLNNKAILDSQFKLLYENESLKTGITVIPIEIRSSACAWCVLPEYYVSIPSDKMGKITIGGHNADVLMVDAGTFTVGNSDILSDGNNLYSQSLVNCLQP